MPHRFPYQVGDPVTCLIYRGTLALASGHIIAITDLPGGCKRVRVRYAGGDADYRVTASGHCDYLTPGPPSGC